MKTKNLTVLATALLAFALLSGVLELAGNRNIQPVYGLQKPSGRTTPIAAITRPVYLTATLLLERLPGGDLVELTPPSAQWLFKHFYILPEADAWLMWLNNLHDVSGQRVAVEQYLGSTDGLIWFNRTDTNLVDNVPDSHTLNGIRAVVRSGNIYQGWEGTYFNVVNGMWVRTIRYITSTNGLNWQVVTPEIIASAGAFNIERDGNLYEMWALPYGDAGYTGSRSLRYRTSDFPDSGWGHWQTGGSLVLVDGEEVGKETRVRKLTDGAYQLFYQSVAPSPHINLAVGTDGINFTTTITDLVDFATILPDYAAFQDMFVLDMNGKDWIYFTYRDVYGNGRIAVTRPADPTAVSLQDFAVFPGEHHWVGQVFLAGAGFGLAFVAFIQRKRSARYAPGNR